MSTILRRGREGGERERGGREHGRDRRLGHLLDWKTKRLEEEFVRNHTGTRTARDSYMDGKPCGKDIREGVRGVRQFQVTLGKQASRNLTRINSIQCVCVCMYVCVCVCVCVCVDTKHYATLRNVTRVG